MVLAESPAATVTLRSEFFRLLRETAWAAGAGAWMGLIIGGVGGRLAMLLLRLTSPEVAIGIETEDGFIIGQFTIATLNLLAVCTVIGAMAGVGYWLFRIAVPQRRLRLPAWTAFCGLLGGAVLVQSHGVDFLLLEPLTVSVSAFVLIPLVAGVATALLADRWISAPARVSKGTAALRVLPAIPSLIVPIAPILALAGSGGWALLARLPVGVRNGARVVGATAAVGIAALAASDLTRDLLSLAEI